MTFATIIILLSVLMVVVFWKRYNQRKTVPDGLKKLPGPKGQSNS